jgi:hypothetical protein
MVAVLTTLATGLILLGFVVVRESIQKSDGDSKGKIAGIREGFRRLLSSR